MSVGVVAFVSDVLCQPSEYSPNLAWLSWLAVAYRWYNPNPIKTLHHSAIKKYISYVRER